MPRTTAGAVQGILLDNWNGTSSLQPFIEVANLLVTRVATCATDKGETLSAEELEAIERYLAAHYYVVADKTYTNKSTDRASAGFVGQTAKYLEFTEYGQMAVTLDWSGCLSSIASGQRNVASLDWLGKAPSDQTDYTDRD